MAQYEMEMRNEKRNKLLTTQDEPMPLYVKPQLPPPQTEPEELTVNENNNNASSPNNNTVNSTTGGNNGNGTGNVTGNGNGIGTATDVQNIKVEPDLLLTRSSTGTLADDDESSNSEYYLADLRKRKHSVEQSLALTTTNRGKESAACS